MPRVARQAQDLEGLSQPSDAAHEWSPTAPPAQQWNDALNGRAAREDAADRHTRLTRTLECDIIPRLVDVHREPLPPGLGEHTACQRPTARDVEDFVHLVMGRESLPAQAFVDVLGQRGMSVDTIYLDLLAPAAQHLNYLWSRDLCDFAHVTLGLARLQRLLHELSPPLTGEPRPFRGNARRVLLLPAGGEQQTFGLSMVAEFFDHAGWDVDRGHGQRAGNAVDLAQTEWFDVIGLAAGSDTRLQPMRRTILDVRLVSRNKDVRVMVGGPIFAGHPERVKFVGADASGLDGRKAPVHAERLIALRLHSH